MSAWMDLHLTQGRVSHLGNVDVWLMDDIIRFVCVCVCICESLCLGVFANR